MVKSTMETLTEYQPEESLTALQKRLGVDQLVRLSANESPYGPSPKVKQQILTTALDNLNQYPDSESSQLRQALVNLLSVNSNQLVFGNGSDELISLICQAFLNPGDQVIQSTPTFSEYQISTKINGGILQDVNITSDGQINLQKLLAAINPQTALIWLCNPNNPTGRYLKKQAITSFLKQVPAAVTVIIDEAYMDFVDAENNPSMIDLVNKFPNVIVLRTLSKAYGLANLRIGYAVGNSGLIAKLQKLRAPYNISSISDVAGATAVKDQAFLKRVVADNRLEMNRWMNFFKGLDWPFYPSQTNFIFFAAPQAEPLAEWLKHHGYLLRTGLRSGWLRISMGTTAQNKAVRKLIEQFISNY